MSETPPVEPAENDLGTGDADDPAISARLAAFVERLQSLGAITRPEVARAFATVRRDRCLTGFYEDGGSVQRYLTVPQDGVPPGDVLDVAYSDEALVTHLPEPGGDPCAALSSCSQPSLVARMIEWLDVSAGMPILEIGAGTGYNAALLAVLGCRVTSVDVSPTVVWEARASLARLTADGADTSAVSVVHGDGYLGWPDSAPYDRVVVTCAVSGLAPSWVDQLAPRGRILAPVRHGGLSPIMLVTPEPTDAGTGAGPPAVCGRALAPAGFLPATGPLSWRGWRAVAPFVRSAATPITRHRVLPVALDPGALTDLCFAAACLDDRVTRIHVAGAPQEWGGCGVFDPETASAALFTRDAVILAGDPVALDVAVALIGRWKRLGRPKVTDWTCRFGPAGPPDAPILIAMDWTCAAAA